MSWNNVQSVITSFWQNHYHWFVAILVLLVCGAITSSFLSKKKMSKSAALILPWLGAYIYLLGDMTNVSWVEWLFSVPVLGFGLWRLSVTLQPKAWNATSELASGKVVTHMGIHWPGMIGCLIFHSSLLWLIWSQTTLVVLLAPIGVVGGYLVSCIYNPALRQRWVVFLFKKPRYGTPGIATLPADEQKYEAAIRERYGVQESKFWNILLLNKRWMDNGLNLILIPSWFPGLYIEILAMEILEVNGPNEKGLQTGFIPTNPELFEIHTDDKSSTVDIKKSSQTAGPPVNVHFVFKGHRYDPRPFLRLSDNDRGDDEKYRGFMTRIVLGVVREMTSMLTADEAILGNTYGTDINVLNQRRRDRLERVLVRAFRDAAESQTDANARISKRASAQRDAEEMLDDIFTAIELRKNGRNYPNILQYLEAELAVYAGFWITSFTQLDVDPAPEIEAAQKAKRAAAIAVEVAELEKQARGLKGEGERDYWVRQIEGIGNAIQDGYQQEALRNLIALRLAEGGNTILAAGFDNLINLLKK